MKRELFRRLVRLRRIGLFVFVWTFGTPSADSTFADDPLFSYDCDALPDDAGWELYNDCGQWCTKSIENGHFVIQWVPLGGGTLVNYSRLISPGSGDPPPPPSLWVEYRYRSNRPLISYNGCDGQLATNYRNCRETVNLYGDTVLNFGGFHSVDDLPLFEFYTVRFESNNGSLYRIAVNGTVFMIDTQNSPTATYLQMRGFGGCASEPDNIAVRNEWDFVRYGTIGYGERIIASDPPSGFLDPQVHSGLHSFTVTFDSPNFVYVNQIAVSAEGGSGGDPPRVQWTRRLDNGPNNIVEIVLDPAFGGLPLDARTTFTFTDIDPANPNQPTIQTIRYTYQRGDVNADGLWNLRDFASLQNCFNGMAIGNACAAFNYTASFLIELSDFAAFLEDFINSGP
jgi:hypothetical protein